MSLVYNIESVKLLSHVRLFVTPWAVAYQALPFMELSRQKYWRGLPLPSPGRSSQPRDRTQVSRIAGRRFTVWATREAREVYNIICTRKYPIYKLILYQIFRFSFEIQTSVQFSHLGFPGGSEVKASASNVGDAGSIPGSGRSSGGGHGNPVQYSCLENPHGQRSLVDYSPWGHKESDMTEATVHTYMHACNLSIFNMSIMKIWCHERIRMVCIKRVRRRISSSISITFGRLAD